MNAEIEGLRRIADSLEAAMAPSAANGLAATFSGLELLAVLEQVVDDLQPLLNPYEAVFYWFMFRNSWISTGKPYIRMGQRRMANVIRSSRGQGGAVSQGHIKETLESLRKFGAISLQGEPSREGTLYKVLVPDEIEACKKFRTSRKPEATFGLVNESKLDYYNVRENRMKVYERDSYTCQYCSKQLTLYTATLDHIHPISEGGTNDFENLITACLDCNSRKNNRLVGNFLIER